MPKQPSYSHSPDGSFLSSCFRIGELLHKASAEEKEALKKRDPKKCDKKRKTK